jgi:hypothetical protein
MIVNNLDSVKNSHSGYYEVGSGFYINKSDALAAATTLKVTPKWRFFDDVWSQQTWTGPPDSNIYELYRARAQQLREKYDYICLSFSGGSDSTTALNAFVDAGIFVDEIVVKWPIKATANYSPSDQDYSSANFLSEWQLTILPLLNYYKTVLPATTKITVLDWSDQLLNESPEELIWKSQDFFNPATYFKHSLVSQDTVKAIDAGKSTCILYGVDRPRFLQRNRQIYCVFQDVLAHHQPGHKYSDYVEFFFWTPDFPDIITCQAKHIFQHILKNPELLKLINHLPIPNKPPPPVIKTKEALQWRDLVRNLIYPEYSKHQWFQADKSISRMSSPTDFWMFNNNTISTYMQSWESNIKNRFASIDEKFIERRGTDIIGYTRFNSTMYRLGIIPE